MKKIAVILTFLVSALFSLNLNDIKSIKTQFYQEIINSSGNKIYYKGTMFAKKDKNQALWIYQQPIYKEIYYLNGKIVIIEPDLEQATFAKLKKIPNIITLLKSAKKIDNNTYVTKFNNTKYFITLKNNTLYKISYIDEMKNKVNVTLINPKINIDISDQRFQYHIPKGYDILKE